MKDNPLIEQSLAFSIHIVQYYKWLTAELHEFVLSKQLLRSGTSIGANIYEANYAISRADFIAKMQIALKETSETEYWLVLLQETGYLPQQYHHLHSSCLSLKRMLIATLNTSKNESE